ncbi:hypothetical protein ACWEWX_49280, partial [Streptomyces asiaticus]
MERGHGGPRLLGFALGIDLGRGSVVGRGRGVVLQLRGQACLPYPLGEAGGRPLGGHRALLRAPALRPGAPRALVAALGLVLAPALGLVLTLALTFGALGPGRLPRALRTAVPSAGRALDRPAVVGDQDRWASRTVRRRLAQEVLELVQ